MKNKIQLIIMLFLILSSFSSYSSTQLDRVKKINKKFDKCIYKVLKKKKVDIFFIEKITMLKSEALVNSHNEVFLQTQFRKCKLLKKDTYIYETQDVNEITQDLTILKEGNIISKDIFEYIMDVYRVKSSRKFAKKYSMKAIEPNPSI